MTVTLDGSAGVTTNTGAVYNSLQSMTAKAYNWNGSTSNTSLDFTGIPSWVKRVTVMFNGVSISGTSNTLVQVGSGSFSTSGYTGIGTVMGGSTVTTTSTSSGFPIIQNNSGYTLYGNIIITNITGNTWLCSGIVGNSAVAVGMFITSGGINLSGTLDRIRIFADGTQTFDAGSVNVIYE